MSSGGVDTQQSVDFLKAIFQPQDLIHFRLIESWRDRDTNHVKTDVVGKSWKRFGLTVPGLFDPAESSWRFMPDDEIARQIEAIVAASEQRRANVYFGVCPRFGGKGEYELAWQIRTVPALWLDIDDATQKDAAERCKSAGLPIPSVTVDSGGGVHLYWLLETPYHIADAEPQRPHSVVREWSGPKGRRRSQDWMVESETNHQVILSPATRPPLSPDALLIQDIMSGMGVLMGGDHTHDLSRIMRLPGTLNRKDERHGRETRPCRVVHFSPDTRYPLDRFTQYAEKSEKRRERRAIERIRLSNKKEKIASGRGGAKAQAEFDDLINICSAAEVGTRSHADFSLCCRAIERGWPKDEVWAAASQVGKFAERGEDYFDATWENAKYNVKETKFYRLRDRIKLKSDSESGLPVSPSVTPSSGDNGKYGPHVEGNAATEGTNQKPEVPMFGNDVTVTSTVTEFGRLLGKTCRFFRRGGVIQRAIESEHGDLFLQTIKPASLPFDLEAVARVVDLVHGEDGGVYTRPTTCSESQARIILESPGFFNQLPPIRVVSPCPVLTEIAGKLVQIHGYNRERGVLAYGPEIVIPPIDEAKQLLNLATSQFRYVSDHDRARHLASIITPALIHGQLLGISKRAPMDLTESDESQTGKGFKNKLTAAIYNQTVEPVKQRRAGVGSVEEDFDKALASGRQFISLDNIRGQVDLPSLESYLTEDRYTARYAYSPPVVIDVANSGTTIMFTSNAADVTPDLANRSSIVRLLKQHRDFDFSTFQEGNLLDHVRENWPKFLGAVFAVIQAWYEAGKPKIPKPDHSFRDWAGTLDWIVQNVLDAAPLLSGHRDIQLRTSTPKMNWLREVTLAVERSGQLNFWLKASDIVNILIDSDVEVPSMTPTTDMEDETQAGNIFRAMGRRLSRVFGARHTLTVDHYIVHKDEQEDFGSRPKKMYQFSVFDGIEPQEGDSEPDKDNQPYLFGDDPQWDTQPPAATSDGLCDDGKPHVWEVATESDGKTRRWCKRCKYFGGFVERDDF